MGAPDRHVLWGMYGYATMPKRKDPEVPVRAAVALASWPGATAKDVEERVTRVVEHALSENSKIEKLESTTRAGVAVVTITLDKNAADPAEEFDDIWLKLSSIQGLPQGATLEFKKDFGDTSALMLTVASPIASDVEIQLRADRIAQEIRKVREDSGGEHATLIASFPHSLDAREFEAVGQELAVHARQRGAEQVKVVSGPGFFGIETVTKRVVGGAIRHRFWVLAGAAVVFAAGVAGTRDLKQAFFPKDISYLSYIDVWLPEDSPIATTRGTASEVEAVVRELGAQYGLKSVTTFVGGGGPRFWFSVSPEQRQSNYAQLVMVVEDKHQTQYFVQPLQAAISERVAGARVDVHQLESGPGVALPVQIRVSGQEIATLREVAGKVEDILHESPYAERVRDNWGADNFTVKLRIDAERANAAGVTNQDVSRASSSALNGTNVGTLYENDHKVPIIARLRASERQELSDVGNLYVYSGQNASAKVPLRQVSELDFGRTTAKILRRNHARTISVGAFPIAGYLPTDVLADIRPKLDALREELPPGYNVVIGGEQEEQDRSFKDLVVVLVISVLAIFIALVLQFRNAVKPWIVFAAIPFGVSAALMSLRAMGAPFGFMAFLGIISLIGVIVSHVIVLFDFIEEQHAHGAPLMEALLDAGILRLRPVLVTVGATVLGLFPLAMHGGPLWEPLCYVQIGGLTAATVVTLVLVPVLYSVFVLDLKLVKWDAPHRAEKSERVALNAEPLAAE